MVKQADSLLDLASLEAEAVRVGFALRHAVAIRASTVLERRFPTHQLQSQVCQQARVEKFA